MRFGAKSMASNQDTLKQPDGVSGLPFLGNMTDFAHNPLRFISRLQQLSLIHISEPTRPY